MLGLITGGAVVVNVSGLCCAKDGVVCDSSTGAIPADGCGDTACNGGCATKNAIGHDSAKSTVGSCGMSGASIEAVPKI